jgi:probable rRNA maturation factor
MDGDGTPRLAVSVCHADGRPARQSGLARWLAATAPASARGTVTLVLADDADVRRLNRAWRGINRPTDVLSFPTDRSTPAPRGVARHLGDIVIATGVARAQAAEAGHAYGTELRVLALHGLLHLLGYDHETDAGRMARAERRLRRKGGLPLGLIEREQGT